MPETWLHTRWPDARETLYYSPSSVIRDHFVPGQIYNVPEFLALAGIAFHQASDRVQRKYGFPCARAAASLAAIQQYAATYAAHADARITILEISP